jgi:hypothetical protein
VRVWRERERERGRDGWRVDINVLIYMQIYGLRAPIA